MIMPEYRGFDGLNLRPASGALTWLHAPSEILHPWAAFVTQRTLRFGQHDSSSLTDGLDFSYRQLSGPV